MADQKISQLTAYATPVGTDVIPIVDVTNSSTKKMTLATLFTAGNQALFKVISADATGQNVNTAQPWFPTAGGVTVAATTTYIFEGMLYLTRSAGVTSHTLSLLFGGTATLTGITYLARCISGDTGGNTALNGTIINSASATLVKSSSTSASEVIALFVSGIVRVNAAGTLIPQFQYSAPPGGAPTVKANSYFQLYPIGTNAVVSQGTWA